MLSHGYDEQFGAAVAYIGRYQNIDFTVKEGATIGRLLDAQKLLQGRSSDFLHGLLADKLIAGKLAGYPENRFPGGTCVREMANFTYSGRKMNGKVPHSTYVLNVLPDGWIEMTGIEREIPKIMRMFKDVHPDGTATIFELPRDQTKAE